MRRKTTPQYLIIYMYVQNGKKKTLHVQSTLYSLDEFKAGLDINGLGIKVSDNNYISGI